MKYKISLKLMMLACLVSCSSVSADENCPSSPSCAPCGEVITNLPVPASQYDNCGVNPLQNYIATYENCMRGGWNGFYVSTGFGYGAIDYNLKIPGLLVKDVTNGYITEYVTIGYAHTVNGFFIAGELGYYYNSVTSPIFYDDPSFFTFVPDGIDPAAITARPCGIRLDINSQNHVALDLLPGFILTQRLTIFGRIGLEYDDYSWVRRTCLPQAGIVLDEDGNPVLVETDDLDIGDKQSDAVVDFRLGAGISFAAGSHVSFNINYIHIFGSAATFTPNVSLINNALDLDIVDEFLLPVPGTLVGNIAKLSAQNTIDPDRNEILFGVTFTF